MQRTWPSHSQTPSLRLSRALRIATLSPLTLPSFQLPTGLGVKVKYVVHQAALCSRVSGGR